MEQLAKKSPQECQFTHHTEIHIRSLGLNQNSDNYDNKQEIQNTMPTVRSSGSQSQGQELVNTDVI